MEQARTDALDKAVQLLREYQADKLNLTYYVTPSSATLSNLERNTAARIMEYGRQDSIDQLAELKRLFRTYIDMRASQSMSWSFMETVVKALEEDANG